MGPPQLLGAEVDDAPANLVPGRAAAGSHESKSPTIWDPYGDSLVFENHKYGVHEPWSKLLMAIES